MFTAITSLQFQHPNEQWWRVGKHATDRLDQMRKLTLFITPKNVGPWRPTEPHQVTRPKRSGQERSQEDSARGLQHRRHREKSVGRQKGENGEAQTAQAHTQQMVMMIRPALLCLYLLLCPSDMIYIRLFGEFIIEGKVMLSVCCKSSIMMWMFLRRIYFTDDFTSTCITFFPILLPSPPLFCATEMDIVKIDDLLPKYRRRYQRLWRKYGLLELKMFLLIVLPSDALYWLYLMCPEIHQNYVNFTLSFWKYRAGWQDSKRTLKMFINKYSYIFFSFLYKKEWTIMNINVLYIFKPWKNTSSHLDLMPVSVSNHRGLICCLLSWTQKNQDPRCW